MKLVSILRYRSGSIIRLRDLEPREILTKSVLERTLLIINSSISVGKWPSSASLKSATDGIEALGIRTDGIRVLGVNTSAKAASL